MEVTQWLQLAETLGPNGVFIGVAIWAVRSMGKSLSDPMHEIKDELREMRREMHGIKDTNQLLARDMAVIVKQVEYHDHRIERLENN